MKISHPEPLEVASMKRRNKAKYRPEIPQDLILWRRPACQTLSKALDISSATARVAPDLLKALATVKKPTKIGSFFKHLIRIYFLIFNPNFLSMWKLFFQQDATIYHFLQFFKITKSTSFSQIALPFHAYLLQGELFLSEP